MLGEIFPNPSAGSVAFTYTLAEPSEVTLAVYDLLGRRVATLVKEPQSAGTHEVDWVGAALPSGPYVLRLDANGEVHTRRLTLVH